MRKKYKKKGSFWSLKTGMLAKTDYSLGFPRIMVQLTNFLPIYKSELSKKNLKRIILKPEKSAN